MTTSNLNYLIKEIQKNNKLAFKKLFEIYYSQLCLYINEIVIDFELSRDIAQDVFSKIWVKRNELSHISDLEKYLFITAKNKAYDYFRKSEVKAKYKSYVENFSDIGYSEEDKIEIEELHNLIIKSIDSLSDKTKDVFLLRKEENKKIKEISQILSMSVQSVNWHLSKAKESIRDSIDNYYSA
jgi:RNA polymerase sigma-70 factor (ECF subfamily)